MPIEARELYRSPSGDSWFLGRDPATGEGLCQTRAECALGRPPADHIEIGAFLSRGPRNPERQALLQLIATLIADGPDVDPT